MTESAELKAARFIPFRSSDLKEMLRSDIPLPEPAKQHFEIGLQRIEQYFQQDFHQLRRALKDAYAPIDPDADTRMVEELYPESWDSSGPGELSELLEGVLRRANYEKVMDKGLQKALKTSSLFQVRLFVDMQDFDEVLLYTRGAEKREETVREFFGLWKRRIRFTNFERVVLYIRLKSELDSESTLGECTPGSTLLKLFQNVPAADLEMLFPNIRIGMRFMDKVLIGVPALVSGGVVLTTKLGATLLLIGSLFGFWLGLSSEPVEMDKAALIAVAASFAALVGYLWKQFSNFRNRKLKYTQALTENLYFKLLDNNAGVFHRVLDDAEESECKESFVAYYILLAQGEALTSAALDSAIEKWFAERWRCEVNFEIDDAMEKLCALQLVTKEGDTYTASIPV